MYITTPLPTREADIFEANYLAATLRARRDLSWAKRAAMIAVLTGAPPDPANDEKEKRKHTLRSFSLIVARCESAATLLGWRPFITPGQKLQLAAAVQRLLDAANQVTVHAAIHPMAAKRGKLGSFRRKPAS